MISFIIIGRNEGWKLTQCLNSVYKSINYISLTDYEIIYVDSNSTDDSIERVKYFKTIKIFKITGLYNAAIARNIGAKEAKGEILCFLDGDLELYEEFMPVMKEADLEKYCLSGQSINYYYDYNGNYLSKKNESQSKISYMAPLTCGYFFIAARRWHEIKGMKTYFKNGQDPDVGLRLAKQGYLMKRMKDIMVNHHTISHKNRKRMWTNIWQKRQLYGTVLLIRENLFNKYTFRYIYKNEKSLVALIVSIIGSFYTPYTFFLYALVAGLRSLRNSSSVMDTINFFFNYLVRDSTNLTGFFFFWPKRNIEPGLYEPIY